MNAFFTVHWFLTGVFEFKDSTSTYSEYLYDWWLEIDNRGY